LLDRFAQLAIEQKKLKKEHQKVSELELVKQFPEWDFFVEPPPQM
jgi:hypothetical protein